MDDSSARLQHTLRAIERGERLASIDGLLIREVLRQLPPSVTTAVHAARDETHATHAGEGSDAYRALLQLQRHQRAKAATLPASAEESKPLVVSTASPTTPASHILPTEKPPTKQQDDEDGAAVRASRRERHAALASTQRLLRASQRDVVDAAHEMDALLAASQAVLSSAFLFERNLTAFCQERSLELIRRVLARFHHRFYELFFRKWVATTLQLRHAAQRRAAATIARVVRGHHARTLRRRLASEAATLRRQARQVVELRVAYRLAQAGKLQRVWKQFQWRQRERARLRRKQAARFLQQRWRDRRLRQNALVAALLNVRAIVAAIKIQKHVRGLLTRNRVARQRRESRRRETAMAILARNASRDAMVHWQLERRGAAFVITRVVYPMVVRQRFRRLARQLKRQRAAKVVAWNVWHWYRSSSKFTQRQQASAAERLRGLMVREQVRLHRAAVVVQKTIRRWWAQQRYEMQQRRSEKLARLKRIKEKRERLTQTHSKAAGGRSAAAAAAVAIVKASAGLADVMKQARRKTPAAGEVDVPSSAASKIQRAFLRHRHHVHFRFVQWRQQACSVEARVRRRHEAATTIQRHVRGLHARRVARVRRAERLVRQRIRQWKWRRASRRTRAAQRILRWLEHKRTQRLATLWKLEKQRQVDSATRLQRWLRRGFFYRKRAARLLAAHRKREEARVFATQSLVVSKQHLMDELVLLSRQDAAFSDSVKSYVKGMVASPAAAPHGKPPVHARFPLLPLVFLVASGLKDPSKWPSLDLKDLVLTKLERSKMVALFKAANKHAATASASHSPQRRHKAADAFSMTDVDLAMAKAAGASKRALTFPEFTGALQSLADIKLTSVVTLWWSKYDGAEARLLALLWHYVLPIQDAKPLADELVAYVDRVADAHSRVIERLFLRRRDVARGQLIKLQQLHQREMDRKRRAIVTVQAGVRRLLARKIHRAKIHAQYEKFIDADWGLPYWMNPKTGFSTWHKPWVLRDDDVASEAVPFPPSDKRLVVPCQGKSGCETCSDWYCYACDEFFCDACEPKFHKQKDGEPAHELERLRKCGLCKFQIASRSCLGCKDAQAKTLKMQKKTITTPLDVESSSRENDDSDDDAGSRFCDVCFAFVHKRGALQVHKSNALVEMCDDCQDDDRLLDADKAPLAARPYARAVQWACTTDKKRVCSCCALLLHPVEACGELAKLQLVTNHMKERAELLAKQQAERDRNDTELIRLRELQVKQERAAKKMQAFWRNSAPLIRARRVARALREAKDAAWRQRQQDMDTQKQFKYRAKHALGNAPPLASDTVAGRKLREMNALQRRQMSIRARAFGLLVAEYMQLGVPLPGVAHATVGDKYLQCSEDLRGWIVNRQTLRLKKLPSQEDRDRARRIKFRHHEPPLEDKAWLHDLEEWMRDPSDSMLVDVDAKQRITEHNVPLARALTLSRDGGTPTPAAQPGDAGRGAEAAEYAMFLVEFSMDPTRVVWISHSLAERFVVWRTQKLRESRARWAEKVQSAESKDADARVATPTASPDVEANPTEAAVSGAAVPEASTQYGAADHAAWRDSGDHGYDQEGYGYDYSNYYTENAWATPQQAAAAYDYSSYDGGSAMGSAGYASAAATGSDAEYAAGPLVSSASYFTADEGNAAAWQAYYAAHPEMARGYDYGSAATEATAYDPYAYGNDYAYASYPQATDPQQQWPSQAAWGSSTVDPAAYDYAQASPAPSSGVYPWEEVYDPTTRQTYYYNRETQQTSWEYPSTR